MTFLQSPAGADPVIVEGLFRAPLARVWQAWTDPDKMILWFGRGPGSFERFTMDLRIGGQWVAVMPGGAGRLEGAYTEIEPERRLAFSWCHIQTRDDGTEAPSGLSQVTVIFTAEGAATRLHLRHEGIAHEDARRGVGGGWEAAFGLLGEAL